MARNLITARELHERLGDPALRLVDTRFDLKDPSAGRRAYEAEHLPGAVHLDLDRDLSSPPGEHGGRHPLPDMRRFAERLGEAGIGDEHEVVVYDDQGGMFAGRAWWLLRYAGHDRVRVLDGGLAAWRDEGLPLEPGAVAPEPARFTLRLRPDMVVDRERVLRALEDPDVRLVDARAPERYRGELEPIDPRAGHIPGALNLPFAGNLEGGRFRDPATLRERFAALEEAEEVVVYCGSGVSACHDLLAIDEAGLPPARLYVGSWSDWTSYEDAPVATGDEP